MTLFLGKSISMKAYWQKIINLTVFSCFIAWPSIGAENDLTTVFFKMPYMATAKLSPNGKFIAAIRYQNTQQKIVLINTETLNESLLMDMKGAFKKNSSISELVWIDNQYIAAQLIEVKKGIENLLNTKNVRRLLIIKRPVDSLGSTQIYSIKSNGWLVHPLPEEKNTLLYAKSGLYSKVYKIKVDLLAIEGKKLNKLSKIDGGQFIKSNEVVKITGFATRWFINKTGKPKAALHFNDKQELTLSTFTGNKSNILKIWKNESHKEDKQKTQIIN